MKKILIFILLILILAGCSQGFESHNDFSNNNTLNNQNNTNIIKKIDKISTVLIDGIHELKTTTLKEIVKNYFLVFDFNMNFSEGENVKYERAFQYMRSAGTYPLENLEYWNIFDKYYDTKLDSYTIPSDVIDNYILDGKIESSYLEGLTVVNGNYITDSYSLALRPALRQYLNKDTYQLTVPSEIVDEFILSKFDTIRDNTDIKEYDKKSQTYSYEPFMGAFYYNVLIYNVIVESEIVKFKCILTHEIQENPQLSYEVSFKISYANGEYKFLSVNIKKR